jgi:GH24 family phage-related lysozyme (muramidase)
MATQFWNSCIGSTIETVQIDRNMAMAEAGKASSVAY